jgi:hypothetical protein
LSIVLASMCAACLLTGQLCTSSTMHMRVHLFVQHIVQQQQQQQLLLQRSTSGPDRRRQRRCRLHCCCRHQRLHTHQTLCVRPPSLSQGHHHTSPANTCSCVQLLTGAKRADRATAEAHAPATAPVTLTCRWVCWAATSTAAAAARQMQRPPVRGMQQACAHDEGGEDQGCATPVGCLWGQHPGIIGVGVQKKCSRARCCAAEHGALQQSTVLCGRGTVAGDRGAKYNTTPPTLLLVPCAPKLRSPALLP